MEFLVSYYRNLIKNLSKNTMQLSEIAALRPVYSIIRIEKAECRIPKQYFRVFPYNLYRNGPSPFETGKRWKSVF